MTEQDLLTRRDPATEQEGAGQDRPQACHEMLLAHVRASDYLPPAVDGVGVYRALQALENSAGDEVMWMFGSGLDDDGLEPEETDVNADLELAAGAGLELAAGEEAL